MAASSTRPRRLYLARHGQSQANLEQRVSGQIDWPLTDKGLDQARGLADVLRHEPLTAIYASSLSRALATAAPTAESHGLRIVSLDALRERACGQREGQRFAVPAALAVDETTDDEEPQDAFRRRVLAGLDHILTELFGPTLVVAHRNTNEVILKALLPDEPALAASVNVKNKYLYEIDLDAPDRIATIRLGGESHGCRYPGLVTA